MSKFDLTGEPGLDAVRGKFGSAMVEHFRAWPMMATNVALAQGLGAEMDQLVQGELEQAKRNLERAKNDKDYALSQAEVVARHIPKGEWGIVKTVPQLRREWWGTETLRVVPPQPHLPLPARVPIAPLELDEAEVERRRLAAAEAKAQLPKDSGEGLEPREGANAKLPSPELQPELDA
jgi:hypothetical protein